MDLNRKKDLLAIATLLLISSGLFSILPSAGQSTYASPDETANAVVVRQIDAHGRVFLPEPLAVTFPWLHPRSWVSVGAKIAPVGFLGWPFFLSLFHFIFGDFILRWGGAFVVLSAIWPMWRLLRPFGRFAAWIGVLITFTAPAMILYANRGLFANAVVVAAGIWGVWLLGWLSVAPRRIGWYALTGALIAWTIAARPLEAMWLVPWWAWSARGLRPNRNQIVAACAAAAIAVLPILWLAREAYGSWMAVGYWTRDNAVATAATGAAASSLKSPFPFGVHPRNILRNVREYLFGLVWPWTSLLIVVAALYLRDKRASLSRWRSHAVWLLSAWTVAILLLVYGSGLYLDHVRADAITIGNSFLRYLLPLAPLTGLSAAWLWSRYSFVRPFRLIACAWFVLLAVFGGFRALIGDDEGLISTRRELIRYTQIRETARQRFHAGDVILSERSDKIFFPEERAVATVTPTGELAALAKQGVKIGLFVRPLSQSQKDDWTQVGLEAQELASFGRESLYRLVPR